jgi:ubiquinone biosynthesis protein Coq4
MHVFQRQDSEQTLAQGLEEYFAANPGLAQSRFMSPQAQEFFRCHDVAHVVFGCNADLDDEAVVKIASILGTTAGLRVLEGYRLHESLEIYRQLRVRDVLRSILNSVVIVPRTAVRCLFQRARWPWKEHGRFLNTSLRELRREFGIRVAHSHAAKDP